MLQVRDLRVSLGGAPIVRGVSFEARPGEWFGLLGANGSGKTTLLRAINGRLEIDGGAVLVGGDDLTGDLAARARRIGFAPPPDSVPLEITGGELIDLLARARRAVLREPRAIYEALDVARLEGVRLGEMSAGMRQRVCVFCAFVGDPDVVILDEPFNWLDPVGAMDLKQALRAYSDAGGILVTALHDIAAFATRCDEGVLLHEGRIVKVFERDEIASGRGDILHFEQVVYDAFKAPASGDA
jgi:ABC-type multidrug transport system ATPase subunit